MTQNKRIKRHQYPSKYNKPQESYLTYLSRKGWAIKAYFYVRGIHVE